MGPTRERFSSLPANPRTRVPRCSFGARTLLATLGLLAAALAIGAPEVSRADDESEAWKLCVRYANGDYRKGGVRLGQDCRGIAINPADVDLQRRTVVTPWDFGAVPDDGIDDSEALGQAFELAIASGRPLDLGGATWRVSQGVVVVGDPHLQNGTIAVDTCGASAATGGTSEEPDKPGLHMVPEEGEETDYTSPVIENVTFEKLQGAFRCVGLLIEDGHNVRLRNVNFSRFTGGEGTGLVLDRVQVLSWVGGFLDRNDRHLDVQSGTDIKIFGVWFQDSRSNVHPGITLEDAAGVGFSSCSLDVSRSQPLLVASGDSKNISFIDSRFEKPACGECKDGESVELSHSAVVVREGVTNIRFVSNYFSNTAEEVSGDREPVVAVPLDFAGAAIFIGNTFPVSSEAVTGEDAGGGGYRSLMNTNLADH